jgi:hypothetical protein
MTFICLGLWTPAWGVPTNFGSVYLNASGSIVESINSEGRKFWYEPSSQTFPLSDVISLGMGLILDSCLWSLYHFSTNLRFQSCYIQFWPSDEFIIRHGNVARGRAHSFLLLTMIFSVVIVCGCVLPLPFIHVPEVMFLLFLHKNGGALTCKWSCRQKIPYSVAEPVPPLWMLIWLSVGLNVTF